MEVQRCDGQASRVAEVAQAVTPEPHQELASSLASAIKPRTDPADRLEKSLAGGLGLPFARLAPERIVPGAAPVEPRDVPTALLPEVEGFVGAVREPEGDGGHCEFGADYGFGADAVVVVEPDERCLARIFQRKRKRAAEAGRDLGGLRVASNQSARLSRS